MGQNILITEEQFNRLFKKEEVDTPLRNLLKCRITEDKKHITYLGRVYDSVTGNELPLTEQAIGITKALGTTGKVGASDDGWSMSDIIHTGVDLISMGADFIVPGSGTMIDVVHALSYVVEAQFESDTKKRDTLYLMGAITGMFALIPGALQSVAPILKRFVKSGGKMALKSMPLLKTAWKWISKNLSTFFTKLPLWIEKALNSSIGKRILGKETSESLMKSVKAFSGRIGRILDDLIKNSDKIIKTVKKSGSRVVDNLSPMHYINKGKILTKKGTVIDLFTKTGKVNPTALSSINRKGGHKLFKDKIVFDLITGKPHSTLSKEGLQVIADNKEFLKMIKKGDFKITDISKDVPLDFIKHKNYIPQSLLGRLPKPLLNNKTAINTLKTLDKSKRLSQYTGKKLVSVGDFLSNINLPPSVLKSMKAIPIGPGPLINMFKIIKNTKGLKSKVLKAGSYYLYLYLMTTIIHEVLCEYGIKNTSHLKRVVKDKESVELDTDIGPVTDSVVNILEIAVNSDFIMGFLERLFLVRECGSASNLKGIIDTSVEAFTNVFGIDNPEINRMVGDVYKEGANLMPDDIKDKYGIDDSDDEKLEISFSDL
jgi:hypothetical protein